MGGGGGGRTGNCENENKQILIGHHSKFVTFPTVSVKTMARLHNTYAPFPFPRDSPFSVTLYNNETDKRGNTSMFHPL